MHISKSRYIIVGVGILFVVLNFYNLYENTLGSWDNGTVLLKYYVQGNVYYHEKINKTINIFTTYFVQ